MMSKLKQSDETGQEETTRKSETVIKSSWRDNGVKGPQIWQKDWCPQGLTNKATDYSCQTPSNNVERTILWFVSGLSKATALRARRSSGPTVALHNQMEDFSLFSHTCCYAPMPKPTWFLSFTPLREKSNMPGSHGEEKPGHSWACYYYSIIP